MINGKTYYQILGVLDDAEDIVIRAAYKVLAQKYHPDKFSGDKSVAEQKMSEINQAYEVLADAVKRRDYDELLGKPDYSSTLEEGDTFDDIPEGNWREITSYFPDLQAITASLRQISRALEVTYKLHLMEKRLFEKRHEIADSFRRVYMEKYFGADPEIQRFARFCIERNLRNTAKSLNKAVSLLGSEVDSERILKKIFNDYYPKLSNENGRLAYRIYTTDDESKLDIEECIYFLYLNKISVDTVGIISYVYTISVDGDVKYYRQSPSQLKAFTKRVAASFLADISERKN